MLSYSDFCQIKTVHIESLFNPSEKFRSYKYISLNLALKEINFRGDWLQFGVHKGQTAKILESFILSDQTLHLFDSFEGLPEAWAQTDFKKGAFKLSLDEIPIFDPEKTKVHKGWFSDTVPTFVSNYSKKIPFIHLDADLYSSTIEVLNGLNHLIVPGTVLLFDEFFLPSPEGISEDECRAFFDWVEKHDRKFQILWKTEWVQCAIKILN